MNNLIFSNNRGTEHTPPPKPKPNPKKKFNFKQFHKNTCKSLNEVENFLHDFHHFTNYIKLYKILK